MLAKLGPKLSPDLRRAFLYMHQSLHILLFLTAIAVLFHVWPYTALCGTALVQITPRFAP
ncbi:MAG: hypothetical protein WA790_19040 [Sulfitobacter sp.]